MSIDALIADLESRVQQAENRLCDAGEQIMLLEANSECLERENAKLKAELADALNHEYAGELNAAKEEINRLKAERDNLVEAIRVFHAAKCRYNTQIAAALIFELAGLQAIYPKDYKPKKEKI